MHSFFFEEAPSKITERLQLCVYSTWNFQELFPPASTSTKLFHQTLLQTHWAPPASSHLRLEGSVQLPQITFCPLKGTSESRGAARLPESVSNTLWSQVKHIWSQSAHPPKCQPCQWDSRVESLPLTFMLRHTHKSYFDVMVPARKSLGNNCRQLWRRWRRGKTHGGLLEGHQDVWMPRGLKYFTKEKHFFPPSPYFDVCTRYCSIQTLQITSAQYLFIEPFPQGHRSGDQVEALHQNLFFSYWDQSQEDPTVCAAVNKVLFLPCLNNDNWTRLGQ